MSWPKPCPVDVLDVVEKVIEIIEARKRYLATALLLKKRKLKMPAHEPKERVCRDDPEPKAGFRRLALPRKHLDYD